MRSLTVVPLLQRLITRRVRADRAVDAFTAEKDDVKVVVAFA